MRHLIRSGFLVAVSLLTSSPAVVKQQAQQRLRAGSPDTVYDIRGFGAKGDGNTIDTPAINKAIEEAAANGGGTVIFRAGTYLSVSIHLQSNITLQLDQGARIVAAEPVPGKVTYDLPEPNQWDMYQDFGHSHWQNSLIGAPVWKMCR